jgi:predicted ATPase
MRGVVRQCLGVSSVPEPVVELISEVSEGNPLLCVEFARALLADGYLTIDNDDCRVAPGRSLWDASLPTTASRVIGSRLDRLSSPEKLALKVASVVGRDFDCQIVEEVYPAGGDRGELRAVFDALVHRGLIEPTVTEQGRWCRFRSPVTHEVVYGTLLFAQRRQLHRAVAEWYERTCDDQPSRYYSALAHHWRRADNPAKAVEYLEKAGQQAARHGEYEEAERYFRESLELEAEAAVLSAEFYDNKDEIDTNDAT